MGRNNKRCKQRMPAGGMTERSASAWEGIYFKKQLVNAYGITIYSTLSGTTARSSALGNGGSPAAGCASRSIGELGLPVHLPSGALFGTSKTGFCFCWVDYVDGAGAGACRCSLIPGKNEHPWPLAIIHSLVHVGLSRVAVCTVFIYEFAWDDWENTFHCLSCPPRSLLPTFTSLA